jgi:hypothetical protein
MNTVLIIILLILILLFLILLFNWNNIKTVGTKYVMNRVIEKMPKIESNPAELIVNENKTAGMLKYSYNGSEYTMYIPFDKKLMRKVGYRVEHELNDLKVDITHQAGIPYFCSSEMLGGGRINVYKDDELLKTFVDSELVNLHYL